MNTTCYPGGMGSLLRSRSGIRQQSSKFRQQHHKAARHWSATSLALPVSHSQRQANRSSPFHIQDYGTRAAPYLPYPHGTSYQSLKNCLHLLGAVPVPLAQLGHAGLCKLPVPTPHALTEKPEETLQRVRFFVAKRIHLPRVRGCPGTGWHTLRRWRAPWRGRARPRRRWALQHRPGTAAPRRRHLGHRLSWPRRRPGTRARRPPIGRAGAECK